PEVAEEVQLFLEGLQRSRFSQEFDARSGLALFADRVARRVSHAPVPGAKAHRQRLSRRRESLALAVQEAIEERQAKGNSGAVEHAAQRGATMNFTGQEDA